MSGDPIYLRREGPIARLILDRPGKRNALNIAMWEAIPKLVEEADADTTAKLLIVQGADPSAFAAGADISEFEEIFATAEGRSRYSDAVYEAEQTLGRCAKPTIAMIQGDCIGGGVELALACDLRFAARDSRFGITPARLGVVYSLTSTRRLMALVGPGMAKDLLYTGRLFDSEEALRIGLVERVFDSETLEAETMAYVDSVERASQYSVKAAKAIVAEIEGGAADETTSSRSLRVEGFAGDDAREGIRAYLEKRAPRFSGS